MGLKDVIHEIGVISSSKDPEDIKFSGHKLKRLLYYQPHWLRSLCDPMEEDDVMKMIELADDVIQNGLPGEEVMESEIEELKRYREETVNDLLK